MPLRATAAGSMTGSAYGARQRRIPWRAPASTTMPTLYPTMFAGTVPSVLRPTWAYA